MRVEILGRIVVQDPTLPRVCKNDDRAPLLFWSRVEAWAHGALVMYAGR
jgi:hypothetical protein